MDDPWIDTNDGAAGDKVSTDGSAAGRSDALVHGTKGRVDAECFLDAGVEVGEWLGVC